MKKFLKNLFVGNKKRQYSSTMVSYMYNHAHEVEDESQYFFNQKLGLWTFIRLSLATLAFHFMVNGKLVAGAFRELITDKEYNEIKLLLDHVIAQKAEINNS